MLMPYLQEVRRHLHTIPELMYDLPKTSAYVKAELDKLGVPYKYPVAGSGILATIGQGEPKFALRADMDALPIQEEVDVDFKSTHPGKMHACGHDTHMTMLLGAAALLKAREADLGGTVLLLFQPAEEGGAGGKKFVEEGALEGVSGVHGIHVIPFLPAGIVASRDGTIMAAADRFFVDVVGRGGHAAIPQLTIDPVVASAAIVGALQPLVSRETSPTDAAVISVSRFNTGEGASNVIPDSVSMAGTLRALTNTHFEHLRNRITQVITGTAEVHGCKAEVRWSEQAYGATVNAPEMVGLVEGAAKQLVGASRWQRLPEPTMAAEDFSFLADAVPGAFTFLGIKNETAGSVHGLHTAQFQMDEAQMPLGAALHASVALNFFAKECSSQPDRNEL
ncbi:IAA-amino acid hydrolase ILR1-like 5 [Coccomyxa sp. Obi]|nr:IAA-amino acid hydrolase ILR1-like 5 [Coccomyxa sp. Obi]